jgi:assimilatory nitrate reductase catalytic subunit
VTINKDFFDPDRSINYDLQTSGTSREGWTEAARAAERFVPTHCSFCGVQCAMYLRVKGGQVIGVEPRDYPHSRGSLCPKGVVAYQQANHPERLRYPMVRRNGTLMRTSWDDALDFVVGRWQALTR